MAETAKTKIIGLENIDVIGQYISNNNKALSDSINTETKEYLNSKLEEAAGKIASDYNDKYGKLTEELERLKAEGSDANKDAIKELELKLDALIHNTNDMYSALDGINDELKRLDIELTDGLTSIFSEGQINELLHAALIEKTTITDDMIETPNIYCKNLVALIAKFGKITAAQIEAGDITGHNIASNTNIPGTETPLWRIGNYGEGHLASENIKWDVNGNVTFGPGVTVKWDNIEGGNDVKNKLDKFEQERSDLKNSITTNREEVNKLIIDWGSDNLLSPSEITSLKRLVDELTIEYNGIVEKVTDLRDHYKDRVDHTDMDKEIKIEFYNKLNDTISNNSNFTTSYNKAIATCNKYINSKNKNANGCVAIDPAYPLSDINEYYKERDAVLAVYYDASTFYTTYDRFGSKTTWIGEDGIYSGTIMGDSIRGWNIEGLTIGSAATTQLPNYVNWQRYKSDAKTEQEAFDNVQGGTGPSWQIRRNGDGHLAGGQIAWNDSEIILGDKVNIRWAQVSDGDDVIDKKIDRVRESIDSINKILINAGVGSGDGSGGGSNDPNWSPDIASIKERLSELEGFNTTIFKDGIYTGTVLAQNIAGDQIAGVSLYAGVGSGSNYNGSAFAVKDDGTGWLANKALKWYKDENGEWKVELGKGVTIEWGDVDGPEGSGGEGADESTVKKWVKETKLGAYSISSGTVAANLVQSAETGTLEKDTKYYEIDSNGVITNSSTAEFNTTGPKWQIAYDGNGYLANGHIRWDDKGNLTIDGKSVITGIGEAIGDEDTKKEFGNIIAEFIDADKIAVNELFTKPEDQGDSVSISENYIKIKNEQKDEIVKISSNELSDIKLKELIVTSETDADLYQSIISFEKNNSGEYRNTGLYDTAVLKEIMNIGSMSKNGKVNISFAIRFGRGIDSISFVGAEFFNISEDTINDKNIKVELYEQNGSSWIRTNTTGVLTDWKRSSSPYSDDLNQAQKYYNVGSCNLTIPSDGVWGIKIIISEGAIQCTDSLIAPNVGNFNAGIKTIISRNLTDNTKCFTEIAKDGIAITNGFNTLLLNKDGVQMASSASTTDGFYGFRVSNSGIFYCNGGDTWNRWNP